MDEKIPQYLALKFGDAIEQLMLLEKKTRQGGDNASTGKVLVAIADKCLEHGEYQALNEHLVALSKRRGLLKEAYKQMVRRVQTYVQAREENDDAKMKLIDTLLNVSEGKIFLEKQRARLVLHLALIKENEGKVEEATKLLQEVQVETFGTMKKREKTEYILEQMRLCLKKKDFVRAQIISKKINARVFASEPDFGDLKIRFNRLMIEYYASERNHLEVAKCYFNIYQTVTAQLQKSETLKLLTLYSVLAPYNNESSDFMNRLKTEHINELQKIPFFLKLLNTFLTEEVMNWEETRAVCGPHFETTPPFQDAEEATKLWNDLQLRIIGHNLRVIAKYYNRISSKRLSQLLALDSKETEKHLCQLVIKGSIHAKIDRPNGIVVFQKTQAPNDILNSWGADIESLLKIVENVCHLIHRENMIHKLDVDK